MTTQHLSKNQVPSFITSATGYRGNKFRCTAVKDGYEFSTYNFWSGGSKTTYYLIERATGKVSSFPAVEVMKDTTVPTYKLEAGTVLVEHSIFCGKDMGLNITYLQSDMPILPTTEKPSEDLSEAEILVLVVTKSYKASHRKDELYRTLRAHIRAGHIDKGSQLVADLNGEDKYDQVRLSLRDKGYMNKRLALTIEGKNKAETFGSWDKYTWQKWGSEYN